MAHHRSDVLAHAVALLDTHGLAALTMRRLGAELEVQPSAIYHHFASKQALLANVWGFDPAGSSHTLETHVYRLRQKIEADPSEARLLLTAEGGYQLAGAWTRAATGVDDRPGAHSGVVNGVD